VIGARRRFNTAGPCLAEFHYMLPPERRLPEVRDLVEARGYFVVHAPRQVGKTTTLRALATELTAEGRFGAALLTMETGAAFRDPGPAEAAILSAWRTLASEQLPAELRPPPWPEAAEGGRILAALEAWALSAPRPLVLFLDEIDALQDEVLISVLRQLRAGHPSRPAHFPSTVALVGLRDVRDYKVNADGAQRLGTASPFNIKVASLTLSDFTPEEVSALLEQHSADTGQRFTPDAIARTFELTQGQPWLVNALAAEAVAAASGSAELTVAAIDRARDVLVARQDTHLDSLAERLREPRVQAVIEPILAGESLPSVPPDDLRFVIDLGLVRTSTEGGLVIANPIYQETIPRVLAMTPRYSLPATRATWRRADGTLDADALMQAFLTFWRQHGQPLFASAPYHEVAPHLVFLAFLDRVANGGGTISREYALGTGRLDVLLEYGPPERRERFAFELKVHRDGRPDPRTEGLEQLDAYLARASLDAGWLVIFDRRSGLAPLEARVSVEAATTPSGRAVQVVRG
jgi:hypothetical protein